MPRSRKFLIENQRDLEALQYLLAPPSFADVQEFRLCSRDAKDFAAQHDLLVTAGWGVGLEAGAWLCGLRNLVVAAMRHLEFVEHLALMLHKWNIQRMKVFLDMGVDLFIRRGWYESTDFWSPRLFKRFVLPYLKKKIQMAHRTDTRFGYIMTTGTMPLLDMLIEAGLDVLIGVDPVQGKSTDLEAMKRKLKSKLCLWGGVNGFITVEKGTREQVREAVSTAVETLGPSGGFILSPVDNIRDESKETWENVLVMLERWEEIKKYPVS